MRHRWVRVPDTREKVAAHGWGPRRRCVNCGKEQSKISHVTWGRVEGYYWYPHAARCKPEGEMMLTREEADTIAQLIDLATAGNWPDVRDGMLERGYLAEDVVEAMQKLTDIAGCDKLLELSDFES